VALVGASYKATKSLAPPQITQISRKGSNGLSKRRFRKLKLIIFALLGVALLCVLSRLIPTVEVNARAAGEARENAVAKVDYRKGIQPILSTNCYRCHGPEKDKGGLRLDSKEAALKGGDSGPAIIPGNSTASLLIQRVLGLGDGPQMPFKAPPLPTEQIRLLRLWIDQGADWPNEAATTVKPAQATTQTKTQTVAQTTPGTAEVDFTRDVQPVLRASCYQCHSGDKPRAQLRLDSKTLAMKGGVSGPVIVPGDSAKSTLVHRILGEGDEPRMPFKGEPLKPEQIAMIRRWIETGAIWPESAAIDKIDKLEKHWAFVAPIRPPLPAVKNRKWIRDPIDRFVLARLEKEGLSPSPEAAKETLIRRLSLDLTGLPPTVAEVDQFISDRNPNAYEKLVDRLLASPRYGERMASRWLDAARYADTNGYQVDGDRQMWRWRDWVIDAFNRNMPFDQFTIEQLAGDLLPNPTLDQRIATAFNRNHRINAEGGIIPEEYATEYAVDRVDTTSTVWMGLTVGCARCHDHKFDPISQKEYYQLFAYFNNIPEDGRAFDYGNSPPWIAAPTSVGQCWLKELDQQIALTERQLEQRVEKLTSPERRWESSLVATPGRQWFPEDKLYFRLPLDDSSAPVVNETGKPYLDRPVKSATKTYEEQKAGKSQAETKPQPISFREGVPTYVQSPIGKAAQFDGKLYFDAGPFGNFKYRSTSTDYRERFTISAWIRPDSDNAGAIITKMSENVDEKKDGVPCGGGWGLFFVGSKLHFQTIGGCGDNGFRAETEDSFHSGSWHHVGVIFDGHAQYDDRVRIYVDGQSCRLKINQRNFYEFEGSGREPLRVGGGGGPEMRFRGALGDLRIYTKVLDELELSVLACHDFLDEIAGVPTQKRTAAQKSKILSAYLQEGAPADTRELWQKLSELKSRRRALEDTFPTVMVMQEMPEDRPTFVLRRGSYDAPAAKVSRGVPDVLQPMPKEYPANRLGLAKWLVSPDHPLTARVQVNRLWQILFGVGLVKTAEDFGTRGERPSHPELLDWLAVEYRESGWDTKRLLKMIVMSATYRQSSKVTPELLERDPENRLLARGSRFRLSAEMIRDEALDVSGLLVETVGGPSVKPYQPEGLYKDMAFSNLTDYKQDKGEGLWRRSLYTYWKRTVLAPNMQVFDASTREFCKVREGRTNTPLQALDLMDDVTYVEAARVLAERMLKKGGETPAERVSWAFRAATSRQPNTKEQQIVVRDLETEIDYFNRNQQEASKLLSVGVKPYDKNLSASELAAYTMTASLLLNLDEVITRQ